MVGTRVVLNVALPVTLGTNSAVTQAVIDNVNINGSTIGHTSDTDLMTVAELVPSILATTTLLTLTSVSEAAVNKSVVVVVVNAPLITSPVIVVTSTKLGFAIFFSYFYPNTIAIAIALPTDAFVSI